ncbi:MAG TPA: hypothetical protein VNC22_22940 [Sporichthya sp.]|jgi:hypothetical protein|nr:hypothetical protein [Sporichthya sp.]
MKFRALLASLLALSLLTQTACSPLDRLIDAVTQAVNQIWTWSPPTNGQASLNCTVVLYDQAVSNPGFEAHFRPAYVSPSQYILWSQACLSGPKHSLPTVKASGYKNDPAFTKKAVCWATNGYIPGDPDFRCHFDQREDFWWVLALPLSRDGYMAVGVLGT